MSDNLSCVQQNRKIAMAVGAVALGALALRYFAKRVTSKGKNIEETKR